jgi:glycosyltransferase involved in cell wall biosynthesis
MKRFEYAIWAMKWILRQNPRVSLVITGQETEYTDQLRYLVDGLRIEKNVKFVGLVPERDLGTLYQNAAAYVYPSPEEDFGMGIIEAMAAGTPVVAWKNGGPTVTVKDRETGFLIEPYDSDQFAERLLLLVNSPSLVEQLGKAAHRRAVERFSYEQHCRIIAESAMAALKGSQGLELAEVVVAPRVKWPEK